LLKNKLLFFVGVVLCLWTFFSVDAALAKTSIATIIDTKGELYDSEFISQTFPTEMIVNQTYACSVTMKNTGSEPWANTDSRKFKLGCFNVGYYWDIPPVELSGSVAPGQTHTFEFNVTPTRAGRTYFNSKMALFGYMWFGDLSDTIWINIKPNDGDDGGGGDDGSGDGGGDSSNSKTLVIFMGGKGDYPEAQFPDFKLAFQLYKEQLISEGKECNVEWLQAPTNVVLRRAEQLAKEFNQWLLNPDNLDTYDNVYIITHCYGYVVTKNSVLRCFDTELPDGFTPHVPDDLTLDQKQKLQDFYKKAKVISISPLLGGEEFAKMKPTGLPIFMSSELNPTGKFQKWLFINDDIFKDNVKDFESHIVVGDRHLKGIWVTRGNATLKQEVQDWLLEHLDPVSFFIDKNKAWYANYEKEKAEGGKHYEYDKSIFNSLPVPVDSDPHFSMLT